jgi:hypothetical protein
MRWVCAAAALAAIAFVAPACADGFEDWEATGSASTPGSKVWVDEYRRLATTARKTPPEWQMWVDQLSREGLSRSRIANDVAVASPMYAWVPVPQSPSRDSNSLRMVELPPNDEKPRLRVALQPQPR